ncbi:hypothetical protein AYL99_11901 [Fonsecaea erecta]|uniref:Uncharacterized protein n=1 Tax=Fonsecaea erecta TaxID=1367422 RepID=A0A178Z263_9EURO|nr:hypothetical protein AYL99_11901 [Fonsecaea erecta]OAP53879.1 hypothetical protein AYL99_11901 [Fonsecaea erecta]
MRRYNEVVAGKREPKSRSASRGLADDTVRFFRQQSLGANRESPSKTSASRASVSRMTRMPSTSPTRTTKTKSGAAAADHWAEEREEFQMDFCMMAGVEAFQQLTIEDKAACAKGWRLAKAELMQAA